MPHDAWRDVAQVYISAFKDEASTLNVTVRMPPLLTCKFNLTALQTYKLVYYYCPTPKSAACSDNIAPQSNRFQDDANSVFVIAMLKSAGTVTITSVVFLSSSCISCLYWCSWFKRAQDVPACHGYEHYRGTYGPCTEFPRINVLCITSTCMLEGFCLGGKSHHIYLAVCMCERYQ
jgi:hypothetical protein